MPRDALSDRRTGRALNPDRSLGMMLHHSDVLARRVNAGEILDSSIGELLRSMAIGWCDPTCREGQIEQAMRNYEREVKK